MSEKDRAQNFGQACVSIEASTIYVTQALSNVLLSNSRPIFSREPSKNTVEICIGNLSFDNSYVRCPRSAIAELTW